MFYVFRVHLHKSNTFPKYSISARFNGDECSGKSRRQRLRSLDDRVRSPLTVFHLHSRKGWKGERVLSTSPRDSLPREALLRRHRHQAERISSRIVVPESSLPPQPLSRNLSPNDLHSPSSFNSPPCLSGSRYGARVRRAAFR